MNIAKAIFTRLASSPVSELVTGHIQPEGEHQGDRVYPCVIYAVTGGDSDQAYDGPINPRQSMVTLTCLSPDYKVTARVADAVLAVLDGQSGTWGGVVVQGVFLEEGWPRESRVVDVTMAEQGLLDQTEIKFLCWWVST